MNNPAFDLTPPDDGTQADVFLQAWKAAIVLSRHPSWFGAGIDGHLQRATDKKQLMPHVKDIARGINTLPISEASIVAVMVGFFHPAEGARLMTRIGANGIADIAKALGPEQRKAVALLFVNYSGW